MRKMRFTLAGIIFPTTLIAAIVTSLSPGSANATPRLPAICSDRAAIPASDLASPENINTCHIKGREVVMNLGNGQLAGKVHVQAPGKGQGIAVTGTNGEAELTVYTDAYGNVTVKQSLDSGSRGSGKPEATNATIGPAATDPACNESAYNTVGAIWYSPNSSPTLLWYYNDSTASRAGLSASATLGDIRGGNTNMTGGLNNCGYPEGTFLVHGAYQGTTSLYANGNSADTCLSSNGQNTVSWGPIDSSLYDQSTHKGTLAYTCWWYGSSNGLTTLTEADIYLGSNVDLVDSLPPSSSCTYQEDLQTIVTHEWGHAYGLAHEKTEADEVMYPTRVWCHLRRHLGQGDWNGMAGLYGTS